MSEVRRNKSCQRKSRLDVGDDIIICRDVDKWFDDFHVLRGISITIKKGEVVVICGPSGSGKSTFIRTINRLEEHQKGDIIVDGIELTNDIRNIAAIRSEIGMVFQSFNLFPHLTVLQNITLAPIRVRKWPKDKAEETATQLLERVGIPEQATKVPRPAVGRAAAARGHRPRPGHGAQDHALRRAHLGPGPGDDQRGARRDARAGPLGHDHDRRHPRDGLCPRGLPIASSSSTRARSWRQAPPDEFFDNPKEERTKLFLSQILTH